MKKRLAILALAFASLSSFAIEANIKAGFDFYRDHNEPVKAPVADKSDKVGFTLGAEILPLNKGIFELGLGSEFNFGVKTAAYNDGTDFFIPVYAVSHLNVYRTENNSSAVYVLGRLGGAAIKKAKFAALEGAADDAVKSGFLGGLYYGAGIGAEVHGAVIELLYDGAYLPSIAKQKEVEFADQMMQNKVGVKFGFRFGDYKTKAPEVVKDVVKEEIVVVPPKMEEPVITPPVVEEVVVETPKVEKPKVEKPKVEKPKVEKPKVEIPPVKVEKPKVEITENNIPEFIHANCSTEAKICTIYGFKVDDRIPNDTEKKSLEEVVELVNDYAVSGKVEVVGHTDSTGSVAYNDKLSVERATNIAKLLQEYGLKKEISIVKITGKGELSPAETNKTKVGRYKNRRVELKFIELETK